MNTKGNTEHHVVEVSRFKKRKGWIGICRL